MYHPKITAFWRYLCFLVLSMSSGLCAQTDTLPVYDLLGLTVSAAQTSLPINSPVARLKADDLARYDNTSLLAGFNSVPGARFEQRSPGSYRISIRGSSLRAPFGVRNVKLYWNGLPLTEPGGDTFLNFLDPTNVQSLTIFKGPAGSLYGAGTGGAVLLNSSSGKEGDQLNLQVGQFGSARLAWEHRREHGLNNYSQIRLAHQRTDGWREHSQLERTVAELGLYHRGENGHGRSLHVLATDLHYEIPGGLNPEQYEDNPRQARPGSVDSRAAINYQNLLIGGKLYGPLFHGNIHHETGLYASANLFNHPFNIDHKRESNLGIGFRSVLQLEQNIEALGLLKLATGLEAQLANKAARNYTPDAGEPRELNFIDDIATRQAMLFINGELWLPTQWQFTLGLSAQQLHYQVDRTFDVEGNPGLITSNFSWVIAPRISVAKKWFTGLVSYSFFAAYGRAYSPPTLSEFRTNEGSVNTDLEPAQGDSYEIGFRRQSLSGFNVDFNIYVQRLDQSITTFQDASGVQLFRNAGGSNQFGIELAVARELLPARKYADHFINRLNVRIAYTLQEGTYRDYRPNDDDFSGQDLPGLTPHIFDGQITLESKEGHYLRLGLHTSAKTPLDDKNDVFSDAFAILRLRAGQQFLWGNRTIDAYVGGDNLLDQQYSLGYDLNPQFGRRYFQPAWGRNFYLGAKVSF